MTRRVLLVALLAVGCRAGEERQAMTTEDSARTLMEQRVLRASLLALPRIGLSAESLPDAASPGARVLVQYCTQCHSLPSPTAHGAQDWPFIARQMWRFIDEMRGELGVRSPSVADRAALLTYLQANALDVARSLPDGPGRETFVAVCARCHVLPDPRQHSPVDWPNVLMRMERNSERFHVGAVTRQQAETIIGYLRTAAAASR